MLQQSLELVRSISTLLNDLSEFTIPLGGALARASKSTTRRKHCPPPTPFFTGRDTILQDMHQYFSTKSEQGHIFVLHGLGGSGKSEISRRFVQIAQNSEPKRYILYVLNRVLGLC